MQERTINPISEEAHNLAINTLMTERQELLLYRQHTQNLEKAMEEGRVVNEQLRHSLTLAEEGRNDAECRQRDTAGELEEGQKLLEEATAEIERLTQVISKHVGAR